MEILLPLVDPWRRSSCPLVDPWRRSSCPLWPLAAILLPLVAPGGDPPPMEILLPLVAPGGDPPAPSGPWQRSSCPLVDPWRRSSSHGDPPAPSGPLATILLPWRSSCP
ncbi:hypothetical protein ACOMHN_034360 [Nucella lapillus]